MAKIRVLLYVTPKFKWKYRINWLISLWTRSKYSHAEAWTPRDMTNDVFTQTELIKPSKGDISTSCGYTTVTVTEPVYRTNIFGTCYTSTTRDDNSGTVKRDASLVLTHPEHWEYFEFELTELQYTLLEFIMNKDVDNNKGYAFWDLLKFLSPVHFSDNERAICSEAVNDWLVAIGILLGGGIISPKKLHKKLKEKGYKTVELLNYS